MPCPTLNEYLFTFRHGGSVENHRELNNTLARATKKAAIWIADCFANNPDGSLACHVTIGEPVVNVPDIYEHDSLPGWFVDDVTASIATMNE